MVGSRIGPGMTLPEEPKKSCALETRLLYQNELQEYTASERDEFSSCFAQCTITMPRVASLGGSR
jgi:hypothetical protein